MALTAPQALTLILGALEALPAERVPLLESRGRVLAEDVVAPRDLPPWDNAGMDGYAFRHEAAAGGRQLRIRPEVIGAGATTLPEIGPGDAVKIMTGARVPPGADTVVPIEDAWPEAGVLGLRALPRPGAHVRPAGEDLRRGALALSRGTALRPPEVALLAALGLAAAHVHRRPRVALFATGNELAEPGWPAEGGIYDANSYGLAAQVEEAGGAALLLGIARDDPAELGALLADAFSADAVVTSGGISAGDYDHLAPVLIESGVRLLIRGVAIRPGKPFTFGLRGALPVFALPGNPVAAMVTFEQFVRPALKRLQGCQSVLRPTVEAVLSAQAGEVRSQPGRREYLRCRLVRRRGEYLVESVKRSGSALLSTLVEANGFLVIPEESRGLLPGDRATVQLYDDRDL